LTEELHRASGEDLMVALVLVDFKGLDALAKFYGEVSVTDFLADAADFFKENLRLLDTVSRYGPSGFGIILPETGHKVALVRQRLIQRLVAWIHSRYGANGSVQLELGQASAPKDGSTVNKLIAAAKPQPVSQVVVEEVAKAA
jgi:diguanylate cyclase (GGDEF)-like protein